VNNKIYVGVHKTKDLDDGYMGSGKVIKHAIEKHGIDNFRKDILEFFEDAESMYAREKEVVTDEFLLREDVYNLRRDGNGGFDYINSSGIAKFVGNHNKETKQKISAANTGHPVSEDTIEKIKQNNKRTNASRAKKVREKLTGIAKTDEHKKKISKSLSKWCWVRLGDKRKKVLKSEKEIYISLGYVSCAL